MKSEIEVRNGVKEWTRWWIQQRKKKLIENLSDTMSINPFLMPFIFEYHDLDGFEGLVDLVNGKHLLSGHDTGFGKLIDEKILPYVFGAQKLDKNFRASTPPYIESCFNEIDHIITRDDGSKELLSLKAGRWTIQLTMAQQLNHAFNEILSRHGDVIDKIVVGVFYGKKDELTDKYEILRGINRGAQHSVIDLTSNVKVYAGREFWTWLSGGAESTQEWVLYGIQDALKEEKIHETAAELLETYKEGVIRKYENDTRNDDGSLNWEKLLKKING